MVKTKLLITIATLSVIALGVALSSSLWLITKTPPVLQTKKRVLDHGVKLKINDCVEISSQEMIVIDIEEKQTYILADAKQFYVGPFPITESMLKKIAVKDVDSTEISKLECRELEAKYFAAE